MSKIVLPSVTGADNLSTLNSNFGKIAQALNDKVLYRDNPIGEPNQMKNDLDMNGKRIYNLPQPQLDQEPARFKEFKEAQAAIIIAHQEADRATQEATRAEQEADRAEQAAIFGGANNLKIFDTFVDAQFAALELPDDVYVEVSQDETRAGARTHYKVQAGALVFVVNLDQTRIDITAPTGAALIGGASQVVNSIAALRTLLKTSSSKQAFVTGYYAPGDGGGGAYYYDSTDTTTADNGGTVIVASDGGRWKLSYTGKISVKQFGAKGDGVEDDAAAFNATFLAVKSSYAPKGKYKLNSTITVNNTNGFSFEGEGAALVSPGGSYADTTVLVFDEAPSGSDGLVITNFVGLTLKNFNISQNRAGTGGGRCLYLAGGHDFLIENVKTDSLTGTGGKGIVLGGGTGATCAFLGRIFNCKALTQGGASFESNATNTSLTFDACYQLNGSFRFTGTTYSTLISCASEYAPLYGYSFNSCYGITVLSCAGEQNVRGVFYMENQCHNMVFQAPMGVINNTSGATGTGDLFQIDSSIGTNYSITIINPVSVTPNPATVANIYATAGTGEIDVSGVASVALPKGVSGDATWLLNKLSLSGETEVRPFTSTQFSGWTNVDTPTIAATFIKKGRLVNFNITITPGTSIQAAASARLTIPWTALGGFGANVTDGNATPYSSATVGGTYIYLPATAVLTVPLSVSGQFFIA